MQLLSDRETLESMIEATGGYEVLVGAETTRGHFDIADEIEFDDGSVIADVPVVTVPSVVPGFVKNASIEIVGVSDDFPDLAGDDFVVRVSQRVDDGGLRRLALREG